MYTMKSGSWVRMALAFAAILTIGGTGLVLADPPNPTYVPKSSVLIGPAIVAKGSTQAYTLRVTFTNNAVLDFPPTDGAVFTAVNGTPAGNNITFSSTATKARVGGAFTENNVTTSSSFIVTLQ